MTDAYGEARAAQAKSSLNISRDDNGNLYLGENGEGTLRIQQPASYALFQALSPLQKFSVVQKGLNKELDLFSDAVISGLPPEGKVKWGRGSLLQHYLESLKLLANKIKARESKEVDESLTHAKKFYAKQTTSDKISSDERTLLQEEIEALKAIRRATEDSITAAKRTYNDALILITEHIAISAVTLPSSENPLKRPLNALLALVSDQTLQDQITEKYLRTTLQQLQHTLSDKQHEKQLDAAAIKTIRKNIQTYGRSYLDQLKTMQLAKSKAVLQWTKKLESFIKRSKANDSVRQRLEIEEQSLANITTTYLEAQEWLDEQKLSGITDEINAAVEQLHREAKRHDAMDDDDPQLSDQQVTELLKSLELLDQARQKEYQTQLEQLNEQIKEKEKAAGYNNREVPPFIDEQRRRLVERRNACLKESQTDIAWLGPQQWEEAIEGGSSTYAMKRIAKALVGWIYEKGRRTHSLVGLQSETKEDYAWRYTHWGQLILNSRNSPPKAKMEVTEESLRDNQKNFNKRLNVAEDQLIRLTLRLRALRAERTQIRLNLNMPSPLNKKTASEAQLKTVEDDLATLYREYVTLQIIKQGNLIQRIIDQTGNLKYLRDQKEKTLKKYVTYLSTQARAIDRLTSEVKGLQIAPKNENKIKEASRLQTLELATKELKTTAKSYQRVRSSYQTISRKLVAEMIHLEVDMSILQTAFDDQMEIYTCLKKPDGTFLDLLKDEAKEIFSSVFYGSPSYITPKNFRMRQKYATAGYCLAISVKEWTHYGRYDSLPVLVDQEVRAFLSWADNHPEGALLLANDIALAVGLLSNSELKERLNTALKTKLRTGCASF